MNRSPQISRLSLDLSVKLPIPVPRETWKLEMKKERKSLNDLVGKQD